MIKYQISSNFVQWELSCSMRTDRQTDMTKLIVAFRNFAKAPKMAIHMKTQEWTQIIRLNTTYLMICENFQYLLCLTIHKAPGGASRIFAADQLCQQSLQHINTESSRKQRTQMENTCTPNWSTALHHCVFLVFSFRKACEYKNVCLSFLKGRDGPTSKERTRLIRNAAASIITQECKLRPRNTKQRQVLILLKHFSCNTRKNVESITGC